jgi:hypothetical protein
VARPVCFEHDDVQRGNEDPENDIHDGQVADQNLKSQFKEFSGDEDVEKADAGASTEDVENDKVEQTKAQG